MGNPNATHNSKHTFLLKTDLTKEQVENLLNEYHKNGTEALIQETTSLHQNEVETKNDHLNETTELKVKKQKEKKKKEKKQQKQVPSSIIDNKEEKFFGSVKESEPSEIVHLDRRTYQKDIIYDDALPLFTKPIRKKSLVNRFSGENKDSSFEY